MRKQLQTNKAPNLLPDNLNKTGSAITKVKRTIQTIHQTLFSKRVGGLIGFSRDPPKRQKREFGCQTL